MRKKLEELTNRVFGDGLNEIDKAFDLAKRRQELAKQIQTQMADELKEKMKESAAPADREGTEEATLSAEDSIPVKSTGDFVEGSYQGDITPAEHKQLNYYLDQQVFMARRIQEIDRKIEELTSMKEDFLDTQIKIAYGLDIYVRYLFNNYGIKDGVKLDEKTGRFIRSAEDDSSQLRD